MKKQLGLGVCIAALFFLAVTVSAIPDTEIYNFKASATGIFLFDEHNPTYDGNHSIVRQIELYTFFNESQYYYIVIRKNPADVYPYDDFYISFACDLEPITAFHTTDYTSWVESGQISFKKRFTGSYDVEYVNGTTLTANHGYCYVTESYGLTVNGNTGYTTFNVDLVPVTISAVMTLESYCEEASLQDTITGELSAFENILANNLNFITTLFIIFEILAVVFVSLGIPIMVFMLVRWAIWKITGHRLLDRKE